MKFWDSSALMPLFLAQDWTPEVEDLLANDPEVATWWGASAECGSAAARLRRENRLTPTEEEELLDRLSWLQAASLEILPSDDVRRRTMRLIRVHSLTAADAAQLAAAQVWAGPMRNPEFVTFDERLAMAARLEGFRVLPT